MMILLNKHKTSTLQEKSFTFICSRKNYIQLCVLFTAKSSRDLRFKNALSDAKVLKAK